MPHAGGRLGCTCLRPWALGSRQRVACWGCWGVWRGRRRTPAAGARASELERRASGCVRIESSERCSVYVHIVQHSAWWHHLHLVADQFEQQSTPTFSPNLVSWRSVGSHNSPHSFPHLRPPRTRAVEQSTQTPPSPLRIADKHEARAGCSVRCAGRCVGGR
eukprot:scaffold7656_cov121-Isochrysis_galbana.AAC.1